MLFYLHDDYFSKICVNISRVRFQNMLNLIFGDYAYKKRAMQFVERTVYMVQRPFHKS